MANKFQVKRTTVSGRTPNTTSSGNSRFIDTGELALNLPDGKMFSSNGSVYFEVGANLINSNITGNLTVNAIIANGSIGTAGQQLVSNGSSVYWSSNASTTSVSSNTVSANIVSANNLTINEGISVGNTSVNTSINSTAIFSGNTTSNSLVSPTVITAANTLSNSTINPSTIFVGNSLTNAIVSINQVDTTVSGITSVQLGIQSNPGWIAVFMPGGNTNLPSAATTDYYGSSYVKIANTHPWLNDVNWSYNPVVSNSTCIGYFWDPSLLGNVLKIKSFVRTSGNVVVETVAAHGANTSTFPSGFTAKFVNITALPNGLANTNGVHTLNVVNTTAFWYTVPSAPYKNLTVSNLMFPNGYYGYTGTSASPIMQSTLLTATATAGYFVYFIETSSAHGISNGTSVVVSGITNTPTKVGTVSYQWNGTYKAWTSAPGANSTYFAVLVAAKAAKGAVPSAQTGPVAATGTTPVVQQNINISYTPAVPCFIGPIDTTLSPTGPGASLKQTDPVVLQVANTNTRVRVTPRNIFVGNTSGGTYTIIDQYKITAAKRGSFLSSSVSGDGIRVESLIDDLTPAEANSSFFFANATVMQVGNSTVGSIITSNLISTQEISLANTDDSRSNVSLTSQSVSINTTDSDATYTTTIGSKAATFGGSVQVSSALVLDSTLLANGDPGVAGYVLTSANTSNVYWSSLSGYQTTAGLSANVATLTANNTSFVGSVSAANVVSNAQLSANLASYQTTAGLSANVSTLTANNANNLGGVAAASYVNTSGAYTISGIHTHTANVVVNGAIIAAGSSGSAGQVLTSNGSSNVYWSTVSSGGGGGNITFSATPPVSPTVGNDWIDTDTGIRYTYTYDGDSYQWVEFGTSSLSSGSSDPAIHPFMLAGM